MVRPLIIVGDTPEVERLEQLLAEWGWACLRTTEEEVTLTLARTKPPLLLLSLGGGPGGLASARRLTQRVRSTAYGALVPMVFFGPGPSPSSVDVLCLGGDAFLSLPGDHSAIRSCIQRLAGDPAAPEVAAKRPSIQTAARTGSASEAAPSVRPGREGPVADLDRLGALPWEDLPDLGARRMHLATGPGADTMGLDDAMSADKMLDPRTMAAAIAQQARVGLSVPDGSRTEGSAQATSHAIPTADAGSPVGTASGRADGAAHVSPPDAEVDDLVSQLANRGQDSDTVAVRIQKAIEAFDVAAPPPPLEENEAGSRPSAQSAVQDSGRPRPKTLKGAAGEDGIDLSALDMDTIAGVDVANPDALLDRLSQHPQTPPPPGPVTTVTTSSGGLPIASARLGQGFGLSLSGLSSIPGPVPTSLPGSFSGIPLGDDEPTQPPFYPLGEARVEQPAGKAYPGLPSPQASPAPLASPYDLPPVVAGHPASTLVVERGVVEGRDTVPGRRTAILHGVVVDPDEEPSVEEVAMKTEVTRPQSPASRRGRTAASGALSGRGPAVEAAGQAPSGRVPAPLREGLLEDLDPARLLFRLAEAQATGTLRVEADEGAVELLFQEGRIRFATSTRPGDRMLALLVRRGLISDPQAVEVEAEIATSGRRAGAILLDRGWIKPAELIPSIREHLENLVMEVFGLERGSYVFRAEWPTAEEIVHIEREPASLLFDGVLRKYVPDRVQRLLGATEVRPLRQPEADEGVLSGCALTGKDWRLLDAMDGRHTLGELGRANGVEPSHMWSLAYALHCLGLVSLPAAPSALVDGAAPEGTGVSLVQDESSLEMEIQRILRRRDLADEGDYFAVLGVAPEATVAEITEAYERTLRGLASPPLPATLAERFAAELGEIRTALAEALDVLIDDRLRERYRRFLAASGGTEA